MNNDYTLYISYKFSIVGGRDDSWSHPVYFIPYFPSSAGETTYDTTLYISYKISIVGGRDESYNYSLFKIVRFRYCIFFNIPNFLSLFFSNSNTLFYFFFFFSYVFFDLLLIYYLFAVMVFIWENIVCFSLFCSLYWLLLDCFLLLLLLIILLLKYLQYSLVVLLSLVSFDI